MAFNRVGSRLPNNDDALNARARRSAQNREKKGLGSGRVFDVLNTSDYPNIVQYKPKSGMNNKNIIDIIPFKISQDWYPNLKEKSGAKIGLQPGQLDYKLEVPIHRSLGADNQVVLCLRCAFGKPCQPCEDMFAEYRKAEADRDQKVLKALKTSWRVFYNVYDYSDKEYEDFKIMEMSFAMFETYLLEAILPSEDEPDAAIIPFSNIRSGKTVVWKGKEKKLGENAFIECADIEFEDRTPYEDSIIESTYPLDKMLVIPTPDEVREIYMSIPEGELEEELEEERAEEVSRGRRAFPPKSSDKTTARGRGARERGVQRCPEGFDFGQDFNEYPECRSCPNNIFQLCSRQQEGDIPF